MVPLLRSAILAIWASKDPSSFHSRGWECLEGYHQLGDRTQGWDHRHTHHPTQVSLYFIFYFLHVMTSDMSIR